MTEWWYRVFDYSFLRWYERQSPNLMWYIIACYVVVTLADVGAILEFLLIFFVLRQLFDGTFLLRLQTVILSVIDFVFHPCTFFIVPNKKMVFRRHASLILFFSYVTLTVVNVFEDFTKILTKTHQQLITCPSFFYTHYYDWGDRVDADDVISISAATNVDGRLYAEEFLFGTDAIADLMILLLSFLSFVLVFSPTDDLEDFISQGLFFSFFQGLLELCFASLDLFVFFLFFEVLVVPMFLFFALYSSRYRRFRAYFYFFLYTCVGSIPFLMGIIYLRYAVGTTSLILLEHVPLSFYEQRFLWCFFAPAVLFKIPLCPFHLWLPEAHVEATTGVSVFLAGILLKVGGFAYIRFLYGLFPLGNFFFLDFMYSLAVISCLWAALMSIRQFDMKRIIAYMSIAHMSLALLALNSFTVVGLLGSVLLFLSHGLVSSALFMLVGVLYEQHQVRQLGYYAGLRAVIPCFSFYFIFFIFCNINFPGTAGFITEIFLCVGLSFISYFLVFINFVSSFFLVVASLHLLRVLYGLSSKFALRVLGDLSYEEHVSFFFLAAATLFIGLSPMFFVSSLWCDALFYVQRCYCWLT